MAVPSRAAFAERLAALSAADLRSFVADVWAARGYDVRVAGRVVVASRDGQRSTVVPIVSRRFRGATRPPSDASPDVVVDGSGRASAVATEHGAAYVGPEELYDRLLYGLDREVAERLLDRHLDLPLRVERPAGSDRRPSVGSTGSAPGGRARARGRDDAANARLGGRAWRRRPWLPPDRRTLATAVAVAAAVAVAVALIVGPGTVSRLVTGGGSTDVPAAASAVEEPTTAGDDVGALGAVDPPSGYPPGVSDRRVDGERLAAAHERALTNRSYRWRSRFVVPDSFVDGFGWHETISERAVENASRYRESTVSRRFGDDGDVERFAIDVYSDRNGRYRRLSPPDRDVEYAVFDVTSDRPRPLAWRVEQFLGGETAAVRPVETADGRRYRVVVDDVPARRLNAAESGLRDYRAVALVRPDGLVVSVNVSYDRATDGRRGTYRYRYRYTDIGNVTVAEPAWVERARGNESERPL